MNPANFTYSIAWTDFTEKDTSPSPPREAFTTADAKTPSSIKFTKDSNSKFIVDPSKFNVSLTMNVTNSWVVNGKQTNALLNHEQGHYNLTALSARDMLNDHVPDAFPYQVLGPDHVQRLGETGLPYEGLSDGRVELSIEEPTSWFPEVIERDEGPPSGVRRFMT